MGRASHTSLMGILIGKTVSERSWQHLAFFKSFKDEITNGEPLSILSGAGREAPSLTERSECGWLMNGHRIPAAEERSQALPVRTALSLPSVSCRCQLCG